MSATAPAAAPLLLDVLLFASAADALGASTLRVELPAGATAGDVRAAVLAAAGERPFPRTFRLAVGHQFADDDRPLAAGDEVAVIPPVAGG